MGILDSIFQSTKNSVESSVNMAVRKGINKAKKGVADKSSAAITKAVTHKTKTFTYDAIPTSVDELKALKEADMKDEFGVAALTVLALNAYAVNREVGLAMIDFLNGPSDVAPSDKQFMKDRLSDGRDYLPRSYFKGSTPANNYTPTTPYTIDVEQTAHSKDTYEEGYIRLALRSGGADSERFVVLRKKASTGEWFLWDLQALLSSIRVPQEQNPWA